MMNRLAREVVFWVLFGVGFAGLFGGLAVAERVLWPAPGCGYVKDDLPAGLDLAVVHGMLKADFARLRELSQEQRLSEMRVREAERIAEIDARYARGMARVASDGRGLSAEPQ